MNKKTKSSFRCGNFLVLGFFTYSFFFWVCERNFAHVFGMICTALLCYLIYKVEYKTPREEEKITARDVIYMCVGVVLSSLMEGAPFNLLK